jgi:hypothetical protein
MVLKNSNWFLLLAVLIFSECGQDKKPNTDYSAAGNENDTSFLVAETFNSGFAEAHDTYNGMLAASDGKIYYVLSSQSIDVGGQMYSFDPATKKIKHLGDLTAVCGEKGLHTIVQGKSHVNFIESGGKLYFSTHIGYYTIIDGMEKMGVPPPGYKPYPGGHFLAYDLSSGKFENLAIEPHREGIITTNMDIKRGIIYGISWPTGYLLRYNLNSHKLDDLGPISGKGEDGAAKDFRVLCRSIAVDPDNGRAYMTRSDGTILYCTYDNNEIHEVTNDNLRKDYFGLYDPSSAGSMGYNWRQTAWYPTGKMIYGVHGNSGYLFRFDPSDERVKVLDRITSLPSKHSGMFDQFSYGYLGFALGPDGQTLYYLTGGPIYKNGKRVTGKSETNMGEAKGLEDLHLITYNIPTGHYRDHGPVFYENGDRPLYVNSIAVAHDGTVYTLARITENGKTRTDLVKIKVD